MIVRHFRQSWGSMSPMRALLLNRRLIEALVDAIDYVIAHELCYIAEPQHNSAFFRLLNRVLSDWRRRKELLEQLMA
jgi:predicted metal-dependent hydrolase